MTFESTPSENGGECNDLRSPPTFSNAFRFWLKLGFISFGGPTGQIAVMHTELVEKRRWISESRFLHALNFCMLLPGPEAQQLTIYIGWLLHRTLGGIVAGVLFVLPSALLLWLLSYIYVAYGQVAWIAALFAGLKPVVVAIVAAAVLRIGRRALCNSVMYTIAVAAFVAIYFFNVPFPVIIISAGMIGLVGGRLRPGLFAVMKRHASAADTPASVLDDHHDAPLHARPSLPRAVRIFLTCLLLWWLPIALAAGGWGPSHTLVQEGLFFSKAALVTFGGAYAVLPYVAQQAVEHFGWLNAPAMLDGLGLAETTPGPLIMVVQFVGFMGAWNHQGDMSPLTAATLGAAMTTWVTFVPCFLWIFLGAPHIEQCRDNRRLNAVLSSITAAVVGVVLNLSVWFAGQILLHAGIVAWFDLIIAVVAFAAMTRWKMEIIPIVLAGACVGLLRYFLMNS